MPTQRKEVVAQSLRDLIEDRPRDVQSLFVKAINLYVSTPPESLDERTRRERLQKFIEESLTTKVSP